MKQFVFLFISFFPFNVSNEPCINQFNTHSSPWHSEYTKNSEHIINKSWIAKQTSPAIPFLSRGLALSWHQVSALRFHFLFLPCNIHWALRLTWIQDWGGRSPCKGQSLSWWLRKGTGALSHTGRRKESSVCSPRRLNTSKEAPCAFQPKTAFSVEGLS